jgi:hypothetical protein
VNWVAFVDESMRAPQGAEPGVYRVAAALVDSVDIPDIRAAMQTLSPKPGTRFHWHEESDKGRDKAVALISGLSMLHVVVTGAPLMSAKQERARRLCMRRLLPELERAGVRHVWIDARRLAQNRSDIRAVDAFRQGRLIGRLIRVDHVRSWDEPLLWAPDAVAGVLTGGQPEYRASLDSMLTEYSVRIP